jgi:hypothetical protein
MSEAAWEEEHPASPLEAKADKLDAEADVLEAKAAVVADKPDLGGPLVRPAGKAFEASVMETGSNERTVNYRVVAGQRVASLQFQGVTLTQEWTPVPAERLSDLAAAANRADVKIEAEVV